MSNRPQRIQQSEKLKQPRVQTKQVIHTNLQLPEIKDVPLRYQVANLDKFLDWLRGLESPSEPVILVSWFQLSMLYDYQVQHPGYRYFKSKKRWLEVTKDMKAANFLGRTNSLARFIQGLFEMAKQTCKVLHVRPASMAIGFWTQCVAIKLRSDLYDVAEQLLREHQSCFKNVRSMKNLD